MICGVTVDPATGIDQRKAAFACSALDDQSAEFAKAWGIPYVPVVLFSWDVLLKLSDEEVSRFVADTRLMAIVNDIDTPGALGFHDDVAGVIFARVLAQGDDTWVTASHEKCEMDGDPDCNVYVPMGNGTSQALEACDRVEGDVYTVSADIGGDKMDIALSNYLLRSAFEQNSAGPWDRLSRLKKWDGMTDGGYMIVRDAVGNDSNVFARPYIRAVGAAGHRAMAVKRDRPSSRLARRLRGAV